MIDGLNIGLGITGSFCTFATITQAIIDMKNRGANVIPILTQNASNTDTRFGTSSEFKERICEITGNDIVDTIVGAEPLGPKNMIDIMVIAPCTGNKND